jgi:hypothetical protein
MTMGASHIIRNQTDNRGDAPMESFNSWPIDFFKFSISAIVGGFITYYFGSRSIKKEKIKIAEQNVVGSAGAILQKLHAPFNTAYDVIPLNIELRKNAEILKLNYTGRRRRDFADLADRYFRGEMPFRLGGSKPEILESMIHFISHTKPRA